MLDINYTFTFFFKYTFLFQKKNKYSFEIAAVISFISTLSASLALG